ncbi:MAG: hypothetical protein VW879_04530, partial [Opitutae bacterium]
MSETNEKFANVGYEEGMTHPADLSDADFKEFEEYHLNQPSEEEPKPAEEPEVKPQEEPKAEEMPVEEPKPEEKEVESPDENLEKKNLLDEINRLKQKNDSLNKKIEASTLPKVETPKQEEEVNLWTDETRKKESQELQELKAKVQSFESMFENQKKSLVSEREELEVRKATLD